MPRRHRAKYNKKNRPRSPFLEQSDLMRRVRLRIEKYMGWFGLCWSSCLQSPDGVAVVLNFVNFMTKRLQAWIDENKERWIGELGHGGAKKIVEETKAEIRELYNIKDMLLRWLGKQGHGTYDASQEAFFVRSWVGQLSYHVKRVERGAFRYQAGVVWQRLGLRDEAERVLRAFILISSGNKVAATEYFAWLSIQREEARRLRQLSYREANRE